MKRAIRAAAMLGAAVATIGAASAEPATINNGSQFVTSTGGQIDAHGGGVIKVGQYYYFLGENRNPDYSFRAVSMYRSRDLKTWEFRNDILRSSSAAELNGANIERPKVIYNDRTGKYVMWAHWENGKDYGQARVAVATSDTVDGDYSYNGSFRPLGYDSRDMTVYKDSDGTAYLLSASRVNYDLHIYKLSDDYTKVDSLVINIAGYHREAPAIFKRGGTYFLVTSGASGWTPNRAAYQTATSMAGPWSAPVPFGHANTYNSQPTFILPVQGSMGTSYLYMGDRWAPAIRRPVNESTYVWLPLTFPTPTSLGLPASSQITIDAAKGLVRLGQNMDVVRFRVAHSGQCLNINGASNAYSATAIQFTCGTTSNETFERRPFDGYTQYVAQQSGLCLAQADDSTTRSNVIQTSCSIGARSQWTYSGSRLVNRQSGMCLNVPAASMERAKALITYPCSTNAPNEQWTLVDL